MNTVAVDGVDGLVDELVIVDVETVERSCDDVEESEVTSVDVCSVDEGAVVEDCSEDELLVSDDVAGVSGCFEEVSVDKGASEV